MKPDILKYFATKKMDPWSVKTAVFTSFSGGVDLLDPDPETIDIRDIARSLNRINRYNGHLDHELTVAEHSCNLYNFFKFDRPFDPRVKPLDFLLHDAAEAYTGDIVTPLKRLIAPMIIPIESRILSAIYVKFGLDEPDWALISEVEEEYFPLDFQSGFVPSGSDTRWLRYTLDELHRVSISG